MPTQVVLDHMVASRTQGAEIVRFTGGEPLLDRRLLEFVSYARNLGYPHVEVETNATLALLKMGQNTYLEGLRDAGLTRVWVAMMSAVSTNNDRWTRDHGGTDRTWAALDSMAQLGFPVGLNVAVFRENVETLASLIDAVARRIGDRFDAIRFFVVAPDAAHYSALERGLWAGCARARHHRVDYRFEPTHAPPPCVFSSKFLVVHTPLYASYYHRRDTAETNRKRLEVCDRCALTERCQGGISAAMTSQPESVVAQPPDEAAVAALKAQLGGVLRHKMSQLSVVRLQHTTGLKVEKPNVRVVWACNQRCRFCWVDFDWAAPPKSKIIEQLKQLREDGHVSVSLTGGEPTLLPWLSEIIAYARSVGFQMIQLQTNGMLLYTLEAAQRLLNAGLTDALVSLHSHEPGISDGITQAPGSWQKTVQGVDHLISAGISTALSHVVTSRNVSDTRRFVDMVAERWGQGASIVWSVAAPITDASFRYDDSILPLDVAGPALLEGLRRCLERSIEFTGQNDTCGVPRCVLAQDRRFVVDLSPELANESGFMRPESCKICRHQGACRGVRKAYFRLYGDRGLIPEP